MKTMEINTKEKKIKKIDYIIMIAIAFLYALIAFKDLGNMEPIKTYTKVNKGDVIKVVAIEDARIMIDKLSY